MLATRNAPPVPRPLAALNPAVWRTFGLGALFVVGTLLRLVNLTEPSMWHDEIWSVYISKLPLDQSFAIMQAGDLQPPLFYLLLRPVILVFGENIFFLRLLPLSLGMLALFPLYFMARTFAGEKAAWIASILFTFSSLDLIFSQMVRTYTLLALLVLLSYYLFWQLMTAAKPSWPLWIGYAASTTAMLYSQNLAVLYLTGQGLAWLLLFRNKPLFGRAVAAWSLSLVGWLPYLATFLQQAGGNTYFPKPSFLFLLDGYLAFGAADQAHNGQPFSLLPVTQPYLFVGLAIMFWFGWRNLADRPRARLYLLIFWLVPLALCWLVSQFKSVYADRAFLASAFPFLIILGASCNKFAWPIPKWQRPRNVALLVSALLVAVLSIWSVFSLLGGSYVHNDIRGLAQDAARQLNPVPSGEVRALLQFNGNATVLFDYYSPSGTPPNIQNFPPETEKLLDSASGRVCAITSDATDLLDRPKAALQHFQAWLVARPGQKLLWDKQYPEETLRLQCWEFSV